MPYVCGCLRGCYLCSCVCVAIYGIVCALWVHTWIWLSLCVGCYMCGVCVRVELVFSLTGTSGWILNAKRSRGVRWWCRRRALKIKENDFTVGWCRFCISVCFVSFILVCPLNIGAYFFLTFFFSLLFFLTCALSTASLELKNNPVIGDCSGIVFNPKTYAPTLSCRVPFNLFDSTGILVVSLPTSSAVLSLVPVLGHGLAYLS